MSRQACTQCGIVKPFDDFAARSKRLGWHISVCRQCVLEGRRERRLANAEAEPDMAAIRAALA